VIKTILSSFLGVILFASMTASAEPGPAADLTGLYAAEGTNPDGSAYAAIVEIIKRKDSYLVRWTQANDEEVIGVGIQRDGALSVSYFGGTPAIVVYSVAGDGKLDGQWTMAGGEGVLYKETLTKVSAVEVQRKPVKPAAPSKPSTSPTSRPRTISI
jgi:hypothetical protein